MSPPPPPSPPPHTHTSSSPLPHNHHTLTAVKMLSSPSATRYTVRTTITFAAKESATDVNVPPVTQQPNQPGVWEPSALSNLRSQSVFLTVTLTSVGVLSVLIWQVPTQSGAEKSTADQITTHSASECCSQWVNLTSGCYKGVKRATVTKESYLVIEFKGLLVCRITYSLASISGSPGKNLGLRLALGMAKGRIQYA